MAGNISPMLHVFVALCRSFFPTLLLSYLAHSSTMDDEPAVSRAFCYLFVLACLGSKWYDAQRMKRATQLAFLLAALFFGACQGHRASQTGSEASPKVSSEAVEQPDASTGSMTEQTISPSREQQEAAEALLKEGAEAPIPAPTTVTTGAAVPGTTADGAPLPASPTGIPGGSGLRLRHFAPPEEASSSSELPPPAPNSVEQHGLRSPSLPGALPMDINGKLTGRDAS